MTIPNNSFKSYFAGLLEGDGSFVVPSSQRDAKNRLRYVKIRVVFNKKDKPLANLLKSHYGGNLEENLDTNYFVWNICCKDQILLICHHVNGYLRTPKINDFSRMIEFIKVRDPLLQFKVLPLDETPIESNAWLAGFTDADGHFNLSITNRKNSNKRIHLQYRIEVKTFYNKSLVMNSENYSSFVPICNTIAEYLGLGIYHRTRKERYHMITISTTSIRTNTNVVEYFERFPLFSSKYLDYIDWKTIHVMQINKLHLTAEGQRFCEEVKRNFNKNRQKLFWDHLNNFYLKVNEK
jgi:hypothetical protein